MRLVLFLFLHLYLYIVHVDFVRSWCTFFWLSLAFVSHPFRFDYCRLRYVLNFPVLNKHFQIILFLTQLCAVNI